MHESFASAAAMIIVGQILRRLFVRDNKTSIALIAKILIYVTIPAVLFRTMSRVRAMPYDGLYLMATCAVYELIMTAIATAVFFRVDRKMRGVSVGSSVSFAIGMFFLSIFESTAGPDGLVLLAFFDAPNAFFVYIAEPMIFHYLSRPKLSARETDFELSLVESAARQAEKDWSPRKFAVQLLFNLCLWGIIIGLTLGLLHVRIPTWIEGIIAIPAQGNATISFLLIGLYLDAEKRSLLALWRYAATSLALRYVVGIATGVGLYFTIGKLFSPLARLVLLIGFSMPLPASVTALAVDNSVDPALPALVTNASFIISFLVLWVMIFVAGVPSTLSMSSSSSI